MRAFAERLTEAMRSKESPVMVGIDPQWDQLPAELRERAITQKGETLAAVASAFLAFGQVVLEKVAAKVPVVKFQAAFFEAAGPAGMFVLHELIALAKQMDLLVVLDGKRNDIGNTAAAYATAYLGQFTVGNTQVTPWGADALTVSPYLGAEGIEPFLTTATKTGTGLFVLVRTSNPGAGKLQDQSIGDATVYQTIADWVEQWSADASEGHRYGPVGAVVGATVPRQVVELRSRMPHAILLIPGYGAQGGTAADTAGAFDEEGLGAVVNNSRGILFAYKNADYANLSWQDAIAAATDAMIADLAKSTPAGKLRR